MNNVFVYIAECNAYFLCLQVFLDYMLFLRKLAIEANLNCQETKEKQLSAAHIRAVLPVW